MKLLLIQIVYTAFAVLALAIGADDVGPSSNATVIVVFAMILMTAGVITRATAEHEAAKLKRQDWRIRW